MTQIDIPFRYDMAQAILDGKKTATSRNTKYGAPGDTFLVCGNVFEITNITPQFLNTIASARYREEGFESEDEFISVWIEIHPRSGWTPHKRVWFHEFEKSSSPSEGEK